MKPLVIYHANCTDGFGAAFAAWKKLGDKAEYRACNYGEEAFRDGETAHNRDVYVLDFSFPPDVTKRLIQDAKKFVWLDHHKTAFEAWAGEERELYIGKTNRVSIVLNNSKSGAMLAWEYFHPDRRIPDFINLIDDRDRWQFKLLNSKAFHAGMTMQKPWTFEKWDTLLESGERGFGEVISVGHTVLAYQEQQVKSLVKYARQCVISRPFAPGEAELETDKTLHSLGLASNTSTHISEVGHELANASGTFGLIWYLGEDGIAKCSLRSNGDYDVSVIAKQFGGGGHKNAAGFSVPVATLLSWLK